MLKDFIKRLFPAPARRTQLQYEELLARLDALEAQNQRLAEHQQELLREERDRLLAERQQKLKVKEEELAARFQKEMDAFAAELSGRGSLTEKVLPFFRRSATPSPDSRCSRGCSSA